MMKNNQFHIIGLAHQLKRINSIHIGNTIVEATNHVKTVE